MNAGAALRLKGFDFSQVFYGKRLSGLAWEWLQDRWLYENELMVIV